MGRKDEPYLYKVFKNIEELGDVMWYIANICTRYGLSLDDVLVKNVKKLNERYQKLYEQERNK